MKVLHVIPTMAASTGGPTAVTLHLCRALSTLDVSCTIFTTDVASTSTAKPTSWGITSEQLPPHADEVEIRFFPIRAPRSWWYSPELSSALNRNVGNFDVVHIHALYLFPQFAAGRACRAANIPYVVSPHGALEPYLRNRNRGRKHLTDWLWQRKMLDSAALVYTTSEREAQLARAAGIKAPIIEGPFGANLTPFMDAYANRAELITSKSSTILLNHGRIDPKKGLDTLIRAMPKVLSNFPDVQLKLVGPDDIGLGIELDQLAEQFNVSNAVTRIGPLTGQDLAEQVASADLWILPSKGENFGVAVAEAMAAGVPVIATNVVDLAAMAAESDAAVIAQDDPEAFADAIIALLADPKRAALIAERGRAFASQYDWSAIAPHFRDLYASVARTTMRRGGTYSDFADLTSGVEGSRS